MRNQKAVTNGPSTPKRHFEQPNLVRRGVPERENGNYGEDGRCEEQEEEPQQRVPNEPQWGYQEMNIIRELCVAIHAFPPDLFVVRLMRQPFGERCRPVLASSAIFALAAASQTSRSRSL